MSDCRFDDSLSAEEGERICREYEAAASNLQRDLRAAMTMVDLLVTERNRWRRLVEDAINMVDADEWMRKASEALYGR